MYIKDIDTVFICNWPLKARGISKTGLYYIDPDGQELESHQPIEGNLLIFSILLLYKTFNALSCYLKVQHKCFPFSSLRYANRYH